METAIASDEVEDGDPVGHGHIERLLGAVLGNLQGQIRHRHQFVAYAVEPFYRAA